MRNWETTEECVPRKNSKIAIAHFYLWIYWCCQDKPHTDDWKMETIHSQFARSLYSHRLLTCLFACMHAYSPQEDSDLSKYSLTQKFNSQNFCISIIHFFSLYCILFLRHDIHFIVHTSSSFDSIVFCFVFFFNIWCDNWKIVSNAIFRIFYFSYSVLQRHIHRAECTFPINLKRLTVESGWPRVEFFSENLIRWDSQLCVCMNVCSCVCVLDLSLQWNMSPHFKIAFGKTVKRGIYLTDLICMFRD